jgi:serine protease Do
MVPHAVRARCRQLAFAGIALVVSACAPAQDAPAPRAALATFETAERRSAIVRTVERTSPAVVNISTETLVRNPYYGRSSPLEWFFGVAPRGPREQYVTNSLGSGVIVDPRGYVVTNEHVVAAASRITVTFVDGKQVEADFVGSASEYDLAVLKLETSGTYPFLGVDFDDELYLGETVIAIGNPFGLQSSVTTGVLSGTHRRGESGGEKYTDFLQTDAAINPGNSGGALLTITGDLIGINTQIDARAQNVGFAIPVARVRKVFDELVRFGEVRNVWLGLDAEALDASDRAFADRLGVPGRRGLLVRRVHVESPAAEAGIEAGDVILQLASEPVRDDAEFYTVLSRLQVGQSVPVVAWRPEQGRVTLTLRAQAFPVERGADLLWRHLGLAVESVTSRTGRRYLAITRVRAGSAGQEVGLEPGLAVLGVDGREVERPEDVYRALARGLQRRTLTLVIGDGRGTYYVPLPVA